MSIGRGSFLIHLSIITCLAAGCTTAHAAEIPKGAVEGALATPVKIYYATDRQRSGRDDPSKYFGNSESSNLTYGTVTVSIPRKDTRGLTERPQWYRFESSENQPGNMVRVKPITGKDAPSFSRELRQEVESTDRKEMFVFIHGFNKSFQDAALHTAQIAYDLGFVGRGGAGVPVMYSWASTEELPPFGYASDKTRASRTRPRLADFITNLAKAGGGSRINIIAQGMGADLLGQVMTDIAKMKDRPVFNQIILAAPDIDPELFEMKIAPNLVSLSALTTMYTSTKDKALRISYGINRARRVGDSTDGPFVVKGVETIDMPQVDFGLRGNSPILEDMFLMLTRRVPASKRNLRDAVSGNGLKYWIRPEQGLP